LTYHAAVLFKQAKQRSAEKSRNQPSPTGSEPGSEPSTAGTRYAKLWSPSNEQDARRQIFNTDDDDDWRVGGQQDYSRLTPYFDKSSTVLDLGCGIGRVASFVAPECAEFWAVDVSPQMLVMASERLASCRNVHYALCEDVKFADVKDASVDLAYCLLVLQHLEREDAFLLLEELRRVIRPTGTVVLTYPNLLSDVYLDCFVGYAHSGAVAEPGRARIYTPQEVERILPAAGFSTEIVAEVEIRVVARPV
jgi:ubiquinone/menaquinone biosynthesis C-methylase UbiE